MARVMFDIDGVLRDFATGWRKKWEYRFGYYPVPSVSWTYLEEVGAEVGMSKGQTRNLIFVEWGYEIMSTSPAHHGAWRTVNELKKRGHHIVFATANTTRETLRGTLVWIADMGLLPNEVMFTKNKWEARADYYLEDRHTTLVTLSERLPDKVIVGIKRPWNSIYDIPNIEKITTVEQYVVIIDYYEQ